MTTQDFTFGGDFAWRPTPAFSQASRLWQFMQQHGLATFDDLMARSTQDVAWFTEAVIQHLDIEFQRPYTQVVDLSRGMKWPTWCVGGQLNMVHNCVDKHAARPDSAHRPAVMWEGEDGHTRTLTYAELHAEVGRCANGLRALGLGKGAVVGVFMPMTPEIVVAVLAIARIGGIILPLFSGYGVNAIVTRLNDAEAQALITADGLFRRGQVTALKPLADEAAAQAPSVRHLVVVHRAGNPITLQAGRDVWWHDLLAAQEAASPLEPTAAEDPLMLIYTSGTTGKPKGALHTHCGFPIKAAQDMAFGTDVRPGDVFYWMTDMGWMMGPWLVFGALILGATVFLYDGAPDFPGPDRLWALVARHHITHLGVSPTLIRALIKFGEAPVHQHDLSSLKMFASTGEPWNPDPWLWLFNVVGQGQRPIINYSGGTEISGGILMGNPLLPLKPCGFAGPCPGMAADVVDEHGQPVRNAVGELVIRAPWIGMTRGFWRDPQRYEETYFSRFPNLWVHGDWAAVDADGQWFILGRSDDTLKVAGKRLGPAEVESILVAHPAVVEAAVIGVPDPVKGTEVVGFCVLRPGHEPTPALREELRDRVAADMGKPLKPRDIKFVRDLPKTRNAKVMRRVIRAAFLGEPLGDISSLENPAAVEDIRAAAA